MDIGTYQTTNIRSVTQPVQTGTVTSVPAGNEQRAQEALSRLSNGQTLEGKVVSDRHRQPDLCVRTA